MMERGASILLVAHSEYRGVYTGIAARLKAEMDACIHLYVSTAQEAAHYRRLDRDGIFASITVARALYDACREPVPDAAKLVAEAQANEAAYGTTINELALGDRHLGRGFALAGYRHPRSRLSEETGYLQMLNGFNRVIDFWAGEIAAKSPSLILNAGKVLNVIARRHRVPTRVLAASRFGNLYYWAVNEFFEHPGIEAAYATRCGTSPIGIEQPYLAYQRNRTAFRQDLSLWRTIRKLALYVLRYGYWNIRGYQKAKGYYLREHLAHTWRRYREMVRLARSRQESLKDLADTPFVFFALATEPETSLQILSPEYFYQLSAIAAVARDLPAGVVLAVKEHYGAVGRRPADFYGQLAEFKNVRILDMAELGVDVAKQAAAVVTISGTVGFEAAAMGKPVICFGRHNIYGFLPHVRVVTDETQLKTYLADALSGAIDAERAAEDGRRFLAAVGEVSFDLLDFVPAEPDKVSDAAVDNAFRALMRELAGASETDAAAGSSAPSRAAG